MTDAALDFDSIDVHPAADEAGTTDYQEISALPDWSDLDHTDDPAPDSAGDADEYSEHWFLQAENGTCVPASVAQIVAEYSGEDIANEDAFVQMAHEAGYFSGGDVSAGMSVYAAADLLEQNGIPATVETGTMSDLTTALDEGRGVLLYVDSGEYWDPEQEDLDEARGRDQGGDHCVVVSEVDYDNGVVYLSDPGHPDGDRMEVPLDEFEQAWGDADNTMIVCDEPSPNRDVQGTDQNDAAPDDRTSDPLFDTDTDTPDLEAVVDWATARPWMLLPLVLGG